MSIIPDTTPAALPLRIRYAPMAERVARFDADAGLLTLAEGIDVEDLVLVLGDVARALAGRPTIHATPVRHLQAVTA